jgi:hypothetical protein
MEGCKCCLIFDEEAREYILKTTWLGGKMNLQCPKTFETVLSMIEGKGWKPTWKWKMYDGSVIDDHDLIDDSWKQTTNHLQTQKTDERETAFCVCRWFVFAHDLIDDSWKQTTNHLQTQKADERESAYSLSNDHMHINLFAVVFNDNIQPLKNCSNISTYFKIGWSSIKSQLIPQNPHK